MNSFYFIDRPWEAGDYLRVLIKLLDDSRMEEIYDSWSKDICTRRIDYSHHNSQYTQMGQAKRDVHELSLGL
jgi:hypothetical protein